MAPEKPVRPRRAFLIFRFWQLDSENTHMHAINLPLHLVGARLALLGLLAWSRRRPPPNERTACSVGTWPTRAWLALLAFRFISRIIERVPWICD